MFSLGKFLGVPEEKRSLLYRIYFAFFASGAMSTLLGAILPEMGEAYNLDYAYRGVLLSAHQIGNLSAVIAAGFIPYLIGRKRSTFILGLGIVIGLLLMTRTWNNELYNEFCCRRMCGDQCRRTESASRLICCRCISVSIHCYCCDSFILENSSVDQCRTDAVNTPASIGKRAFFRTHEKGKR